MYGVRKTWHELRRRGVNDAGRERVARLMRQHGWEGVRRGKRRGTTIPDEAAAEKARDLVKRDFTASRPNQLWVTDLTYVRTWQGFAYLAFILDVYSRMIVGWQLATHMRSSLVVDALEMAVGLRRPAKRKLVAHTDRGSQYTSVHYTDHLDEHGIAPSVGSRGDAYDNAKAEAWVATYKTELVQGRLLRRWRGSVSTTPSGCMKSSMTSRRSSTRRSTRPPSPNQIIQQTLQKIGPQCRSLTPSQKEVKLTPLAETGATRPSRPASQR